MKLLDDKLSRLNIKKPDAMHRAIQTKNYVMKEISPGKPNRFYPKTPI